MANLRNEFEFRSGLLDALGVEHTEADAKNEERWRSKMLDGLGVEYNQNDVNQFDLFRAKLLEGVESKSEEGGGGSSTSYITLYEGEATTIAEQYATYVEIPMDYEVTATAEVPMRVTFQGNTYMTTKKESGDFGAPIDPDTGDTDFSTYPFGGGFNGDIIILVTETAGTYQVKIEIQEYLQIRTVNEA